MDNAVLLRASGVSRRYGAALLSVRLRGRPRGVGRPSDTGSTCRTGKTKPYVRTRSVGVSSVGASTRSTSRRPGRSTRPEPTESASAGTIPSERYPDSEAPRSGHDRRSARVTRVGPFSESVRQADRYESRARHTRISPPESGYRRRIGGRTISGAVRTGGRAVARPGGSWVVGPRTGWSNPNRSRSPTSPRTPSTPPRAGSPSRSLPRSSASRWTPNTRRCFSIAVSLPAPGARWSQSNATRPSVGGSRPPRSGGCVCRRKR